MISAVLPVYKRFNVRFARGAGAYLWDDAGKKYLDFCSGIAVNALGHAHPHLVQTIAQQAGQLMHCSNLYHIGEQEKLAARLAQHTFADTMFFSNSGAEALDCGVKVVRQYFKAKGEKRYRILACKGAFHGRTMAAIAASGWGGFEPNLEGFDHVPYNDIQALEAAITDETAAILVEPVQGEGGIIPASLNYLREVRKLCDERGLLLFFDEVQCGVGRTGKLFAHEWAGVAPDIMMIAKGIGGGFPLGACLMNERAGSVMQAGMHGSTYGGNPLACAVGNAVLDIVLQEGFLTEVDRVARALWHRLVTFVAQYPQAFTLVRGAGLMLGLQCVENNRLVAEKLLAKGLLVVPASDNVIRLLPPLIINQSHIDEALSLLEDYALTVKEAAHAPVVA
jgi:acetylornithine/N-succinyldiaminopimelate aminotransferase